MKTQQKWLIVGSGFKGIIAAYLLAQKGHQVMMVDKSTRIGGVLYSEEWNGFMLDKGCHLFDNDEDQITTLVLDILDNEVAPVSVKYASFAKGQKTEGIAVADLGRWGDETSKNILWEMIESATSSTSPSSISGSFYDVMAHRHGKTAATLIDSLVQKTHILSTHEIDASAYHLLPYKRIKFLENEQGTILKQSSFFDERIAISSQANPMQFYQHTAKKYPHRNFYPKKNSLRGFCDKALVKLQEMGVDMQMGKAVEYIKPSGGAVEVAFGSGSRRVDYLFWASPQELIPRLFGLEQSISDYIFAVPMVLYYFVVKRDKISDYTYIHNFNKSDYTFRVSFPSNYHQDVIQADLVYVCVEVPQQLGTDLWEQPKNFTQVIWRELQDMGLVKSETFEDVLIQKTPVSYKVPKLGYQDVLSHTLGKIDTTRILGLSEWEFTKNNIIRSLYKIFE
ncbi:MAG: NAD(P)-binding protein [Bernardetiaceae bacterium]